MKWAKILFVALLAGIVLSDPLWREIADTRDHGGGHDDIDVDDLNSAQLANQADPNLAGKINFKLNKTNFEWT